MFNAVLIIFVNDQTNYPGRFTVRISNGNVINSDVRFAQCTALYAQCTRTVSYVDMLCVGVVWLMCINTWYYARNYVHVRTHVRNGIHWYECYPQPNPTAGKRNSSENRSWIVTTAKCCGWRRYPVEKSQKSKWLPHVCNTFVLPCAWSLNERVEGPNGIIRERLDIFYLFFDINYWGIRKITCSHDRAE